jgi:hypothetical protein
LADLLHVESTSKQNIKFEICQNFLTCLNLVFSVVKNSTLPFKDVRSGCSVGVDFPTVAILHFAVCPSF